MALTHRITGMVVEVNLKDLTVRLKDDEEAFCGIQCGQETRIVCEDQELALKALQPGDYIAGECVKAEDGCLSAVKIAVLRPAWRMLESPE